MKGDIIGWTSVDNGVDVSDTSEIDYSNLDIKKFLVANNVPIENLIDGPVYIAIPPPNTGEEPTFQIRTNKTTIQEFQAAVLQETGIELKDIGYGLYNCMMFVWGFDVSNEIPYSSVFGFLRHEARNFKGGMAGSMAQTHKYLIPEGWIIGVLVVDDSGNFKFLSKSLIEEYILY